MTTVKNLFSKILFKKKVIFNGVHFFCIIIIAINKNTPTSDKLISHFRKTIKYF